MLCRIGLCLLTFVVLCTAIGPRRFSSRGSSLAGQRRTATQDVHVNETESSLVRPGNISKPPFLARIQRAPTRSPNLHGFYDFLVANGLNKLCKMIKQADIEDILLSVGPFTLFAPSDDCFTFLPGSVWEGFRKDNEKKRQFIMHHVVPGTISSANVQNDVLIDAARGPPVRCNLYSGGKVWTVSGAQVTQPDMRHGEFTVHIIDNFLYPPATMNNLDYIRSNFDSFHRMLAIADPNNYITEGTFTIFVPDDQAFKAIPEFLTEAIFTNNSILQSVLLNHIVPTSFYQIGFPLGGSLTSLDDNPLRFKTRRGLILVNGVPIVEPDISVTNGVIHIVNRVLLPPNVFEECNCVPTTTTVTRKPTTIRTTTKPRRSTPPITPTETSTPLSRKRTRPPSKVPTRRRQRTTPASTEMTTQSPEVPSTTEPYYRLRKPSFAPLTLPSFESSRLKPTKAPNRAEMTSPTSVESTQPWCKDEASCSCSDEEDCHESDQTKNPEPSKEQPDNLQNEGDDTTKQETSDYNPVSEPSLDKETEVDNYKDEQTEPEPKPKPNIPKPTVETFMDLDCKYDDECQKDPPQQPIDPEKGEPKPTACEGEPDCNSNCPNSKDCSSNDPVLPECPDGENCSTNKGEKDSNPESCDSEENCSNTPEEEDQPSSGSCPPGKFCPKFPQETVPQTEERCPGGKNCPEDQQTLKNDKPVESLCPVGTFCPDTVLLQESDCTGKECPSDSPKPNDCVGQSCPEINKVSDCPEGQPCPDPDSPQKVDCPEGAPCPPGLSKVNECVGQSCSKVDTKPRCPEGQPCPDLDSPQTVDCPEGAPCPPNLDKTNECVGQSCPEVKIKPQCPPGKICPELDSPQRVDCPEDAPCPPYISKNNECIGPSCPEVNKVSQCQTGQFCADDSLQPEKTTKDDLPQNLKTSTIPSDCAGTTCPPKTTPRYPYGITKPRLVPTRRIKPTRKPPGFIRIPYGPLAPKPKPYPSSTTLGEDSNIVTSPGVFIFSTVTTKIPVKPESRPQFAPSDEPEESSETGPETILTTKSEKNPTDENLETSQTVTKSESKTTDDYLQTDSEPVTSSAQFPVSTSIKPDITQTPATAEIITESNSNPEISITTPKEITSSSVQNTVMDQTTSTSEIPPTPVFATSTEPSLTTSELFTQQNSKPTSLPESRKKPDSTTKSSASSTTFETKGPFNFLDEEILTTASSFLSETSEDVTDTLTSIATSKPNELSTSSSLPSGLPAEDITTGPTTSQSVVSTSSPSSLPNPTTEPSLNTLDPPKTLSTSSNKETTVEAVAETTNSPKETEVTTVKSSVPKSTTANILPSDQMPIQSDQTESPREQSTEVSENTSTFMKDSTQSVPSTEKTSDIYKDDDTTPKKSTAPIPVEMSSPLKEKEEEPIVTTQTQDKEINSPSEQEFSSLATEEPVTSTKSQETEESPSPCVDSRKKPQDSDTYTEQTSPAVTKDNKDAQTTPEETNLETTTVPKQAVENEPEETVTVTDPVLSSSSATISETNLTPSSDTSSTDSTLTITKSSSTLIEMTTRVTPEQPSSTERETETYLTTQSLQTQPSTQTVNVQITSEIPVSPDVPVEQTEQTNPSIITVEPSKDVTTLPVTIPDYVKTTPSTKKFIISTETPTTTVCDELDKPCISGKRPSKKNTTPYIEQFPLNDEGVPETVTSSSKDITTGEPKTSEKPLAFPESPVTTKRPRPTIPIIPYVTTPKDNQSESTTTKMSPTRDITPSTASILVIPYVTTPPSEPETLKPVEPTNPPVSFNPTQTTEDNSFYTENTLTTISPQPEYQAPVPDVEELTPEFLDPPNSIEDVLNRPNLVIAKIPVTFHIVLKLFSNVGLTDILLRKGPYTLCVPTDAAFGLLPDGYLQRLQGNGDLLRKILLHHVITSQIPVSSLRNNHIIRTYQGQPVIINVVNAGKLVLIGGSRVLATSRTRNGVLYVVDRVLSDLPQYNLLRAIRNNPELGHFYDYVVNTPIKQVLRARGPFTLVAPTNDAFNQLPPDVLNTLATNQTALEKVLYNHLAAGAYFSAGIHNGLALPTPRSGTLRFTITPDGLLVNDARVLQPDISAGNGVLHVVDQVLLNSPDIFERINNDYDPNGSYPTSSYPSLSQIASGLGVDTFVKWFETSGLLQTVLDGGRYTILAPTEAAIQSLPPTTLKSLQENPTMLQQILKYHVVRGFLQPTVISSEDTAPTLLPGKDVRFNWYKNESELTVSGARLGLDRRRGNIVIQVINKVLYPPTGDIMITISKSPLLRDLSRAVRMTGLDNELSSSSKPYTLFAPTEEAFKNLPAAEYKRLFSDPEAMRRLLKRHMIPGTLFSVGVRNGMVVPSHSGEEITITTKPQCIVVDGVNVLYSDITATNGVVHVLNHLL